MPRFSLAVVLATLVVAAPALARDPRPEDLYLPDDCREKLEERVLGEIDAPGRPAQILGTKLLYGGYVNERLRFGTLVLVRAANRRQAYDFVAQLEWEDNPLSLRQGCKLVALSVPNRGELPPVDGLR